MLEEREQQGRQTEQHRLAQCSRYAEQLMESQKQNSACQRDLDQTRLELDALLRTQHQDHQLGELVSILSTLPEPYDRLSTLVIESTLPKSRNTVF